MDIGETYIFLKYNLSNIYFDLFERSWEIDRNYTNHTKSNYFFNPVFLIHSPTRVYLKIKVVILVLDGWVNCSCFLLVGLAGELKLFTPNSLSG